MNVIARVDKEKRRMTMIHHSATHLLFASLRDVVGDHVSQQGSHVSNEALRFDFNTFDPLDDETLLKIESIVNDKIKANIDVDFIETSVEEAKNMGAIAEFGEKYGDTVRVIDMGYTVDLCGGTHVHNTGEIKKLAIASIENKGSGIYRLTAHVDQAIENIREQLVGFNTEIDKLIHKAHELLEVAKEHDINVTFDDTVNHKIIGSYQDIINKRHEFDDLGQRVRALDKSIKEALKAQTFSQLDEYLSQVVDNTLVLRLENVDKNALKPLADKLLDHLKGGFVFLANVSNDKVTFIAKSDHPSYHSGKIAKEAAMICGGNGGGRPQMAQAGGKDVTKVEDALARVRSMVQ
jgi:alanyl-tRNA synthetase